MRSLRSSSAPRHRRPAAGGRGDKLATWGGGIGWLVIIAVAIALVLHARPGARHRHGALAPPAAAPAAKGKAGPGSAAATQPPAAPGRELSAQPARRHGVSTGTATPAPSPSAAQTPCPMPRLSLGAGLQLDLPVLSTWARAGTGGCPVSARVTP